TLAADLAPESGTPEIVAVDVSGRCVVAWTEDETWYADLALKDVAGLSGVAVGDVDPGRPGPALFASGRSGQIHRIIRDGGAWRAGAVAALVGRQAPRLFAGDLDRARPGDELLAFTSVGEAFAVRPPVEGDGPWETRLVGRFPGKLRDATLLPATESRPARLAAALHCGEAAVLTLAGDRLERVPFAKAPVGFARVARRDGAAGGAETLYVARDDGVVSRHEQQADGSWSETPVYFGAPGLRGLVSGRFSEDADTETLAVFGYDGKVRILARPPGGPWSVETAFVDADRAHWLVAVELDGRNATQELVGCGYSGRVFVLARPPGYGRPGTLVDPDALRD
ncbi:MAG TPA: hypothetical protein VEI02_00220, partial [Planctomycetota bacterium]|nr:hypothetical protein [Planctomycetota bacterium]